MSVEVLVCSPIETDFLIQLDDIVKTRGRENSEVRIVEAWWRSCHVAQSVRWDMVGQLDPQGIRDVVSWVLYNSQSAFENIPVTRMSLINLIKKQVLCGVDF